VSDPDIVCGRMAWKAAGSTQTADIVAGEEVGFHVSHEGDKLAVGLSRLDGLMRYHGS